MVPDDASDSTGINGVVVTWVVAIDPPGVRFPLNAAGIVGVPNFKILFLHKCFSTQYLLCNHYSPVHYPSEARSIFAVSTCFMAPRIVPSKNYLTQLILHNVTPQHQPESCSLRLYRLAVQNPFISIHVGSLVVSTAFASLAGPQNHAACASGVNLHHIPRRTKIARRRIVCSGIMTSPKPLEQSRPCGAGQFFRGTHTIAASASNGETVEYNSKNVICIPNLHLRRLTLCCV